MGALGVAALPDFLAGLCPSCLMACTRDIPYDETPPDYRALRSVTVDDLAKVLAFYLSLSARRVGSGRPVFRCEALTRGTDQCERFADKQRDGRWVCRFCDRSIGLGREVAFAGTEDVAPEPILIWARNRAEAIERAGAMWDIKHRQNI